MRPFHVPALKLLAAFASVLAFDLSSSPVLAQATDAQLQHAVDTALFPSIRSGVPLAFAGLHGTVNRGVVTLTGSAALYSARLDAEADIARIRGVRGIDDRSVVAAASVADATLQARLQARVHAHNIVVTVHQGAVVLSGNNVDPGVARRIFLAVAETSSVRYVTNNLGLLKGLYGSNPPPSYTISSLP